MLHSSGGWEVKGQSGFRFVCLVKVVLCLQDGAFSCVFQKRRMHHHLQKMEGQGSLFLKGFSPIYYESILYGSIASPVLRGHIAAMRCGLLMYHLLSHDFLLLMLQIIFQMSSQRSQACLASLLEQHLLSHDDISSMAMPTFSSV